MITGLKTVSLALLVSGACAWAQAHAAPPTQAAAPPQKVAVINMQEALVSTNDGKKAVADLRAKYGPRDQEFQKRSQDLQAKQEQYRKTQATLSDEQKSKIERYIDSMTKALQRDTDDAKQDKKADFTVNLKTPLADKDIPAVGTDIKGLIGTFDSYTQSPAQIILRDGEIQVEKKPVHKPSAAHRKSAQ